MAISKSTPYVRYKKDFTSSLHLGTIHIESEYLDRTQKTTIESIHGMTWHNKVVNENKELNLLSDTQLELTELEKQYWNTGEKRVSVDEIHTLEEVEPNEDGTYTYTVNSMEGEYIEIYDGINNITSTSDGLDGQFEIVYDTTEEDVSGNIALDSIVPQYEITDSGIGTIIGAKSTGLTLVNHITEPSKEEVVAIEQQEGRHFTIENTVQGNIKSAILKGQTLINLVTQKSGSFNGTRFLRIPLSYTLKTNAKYFVKFNVRESSLTDGVVCRLRIGTNGNIVGGLESDGIITVTGDGYNYIEFYIKNAVDVTNGLDGIVDDIMVIEYQDNMENWDIPYFEGMQSVKMPVLTTSGKNYVKNLRQAYQNVIMFNLHPLKNGETYTYSPINFSIAAGAVDLQSSSTGKSFRIQNWSENKKTFTVPNDGIVYDRIYMTKAGLTYDSSTMNFQIEQGSTITEYEPHKSNILTVNEDVELRGIGDVKDELSTTGELTQRIGEVVLDGSENWNGSRQSDVTNGGFRGYIHISSLSLPNAATSNNVITNRTTNNKWAEGIFIHPQQLIYYAIPDTIKVISTVSEFEQYLSENPITVQYELATPTVKSTVLTVQNQDGNIIPHIQTQQGVTHVSTSSNGLSPVVEVSCSYDTIIKPNTTYTIKLDRPIVSDTMYLQVDLGGTMMMLDADVNAFTIKTPSILSHSQLRLSGAGNTVKEIIVLEGNRVNDKIEYFEGMKNVENPILIVSSCPYVFGKGGRL